MSSEIKIGLALGSGASRGWSHIGIINELASLGIQPDIVCGTSVGAMVGAAYATNRLEKLESWACSVTKFDVARFLDISTSFTGFVNTERFHNFLHEYIADDDDRIEDLAKVYAAISTDLDTGREVWLQQGSVIQAVWSSMALPGLFPAIRHNSQWLVDGGLVNPVPVSVCRALGADIVIAVNLNGDIVGKRLNKTPVKNGSSVSKKLSELVKEYTSLSLFEPANKEHPPSLLDAIAASFNIMQDRLTRSRLAGDPPDIVFSPKLSAIGLLELYRAREAIDEGHMCVQRMVHELEYVVGRVKRHKHSE
jgi:NTE family protein